MDNQKYFEYKGIKFEYNIKKESSKAGVAYSEMEGRKVEIFNITSYISIKISDNFIKNIKNEYYTLTEDDP